MNKSAVRLLLADDDNDDCELFKDVLDEMPLLTSLITVNDGEKLMQVLNAHTTVLPDVLFLDLNMPRKNGFECLSEIRMDEKLKELPVIIFSTSFDKEIVNKLYKNGAQHYIRKPNEFCKLKQVIHTALVSVTNARSVNTNFEDFVLTP